jgi:hypothetical protein
MSSVMVVAAQDLTPWLLITVMYVQCPPKEYCAEILSIMLQIHPQIRDFVIAVLSQRSVATNLFNSVGSQLSCGSEISTQSQMDLLALTNFDWLPNPLCRVWHEWSFQHHHSAHFLLWVAAIFYLSSSLAPFCSASSWKAVTDSWMPHLLRSISCSCSLLLYS